MEQIKLYNLVMNKNGRRLILNAAPETYENCLKLKAGMSEPDNLNLKIEEFVIDPDEVCVFDIFVYGEPEPVCVGKVYQVVSGGFLVRLYGEQHLNWYENLVEIDGYLKCRSYDWARPALSRCYFERVRTVAWGK